MKSPMIWFDMDGTIADLYSVNGWLEMLINHDEKPYAIAPTLLNMSLLARTLNKLRKQGYKIGIISWLAKNSTPEYDEKVIDAKKKWLNKHLKSVVFEAVEIVPYGTPKQNYLRSSEDILFDDEIGNRENWTGIAYDVHKIIEVLKSLT